MGRSIQQKTGGKVIIRSLILVFILEYYLVDQMEENLWGEGGGVHLVHTVEKKSAHRILMAKHEKDTSENLGRDVKILLKRTIM